MKKIVLAILGFLAVSCGSNVYADTNCGSTNYGKYYCDNDQVLLEVGLDDKFAYGYVDWSKFNQPDMWLQIKYFRTMYVDVPSTRTFNNKIISATYPFKKYTKTSAFAYVSGLSYVGKLFKLELRAYDTVAMQDVMIQSKDIKYISYSGSEALYTFKTDPSELDINDNITIGAVVSNRYKNFYLKVDNLNGAIFKDDFLKFIAKDKYDNQLFDERKIRINVTGI